MAMTPNAMRMLRVMGTSWWIGSGQGSVSADRKAEKQGACGVFVKTRTSASRWNALSRFGPRRGGRASSERALRVDDERALAQAQQHPVAATEAHREPLTNEGERGGCAPPVAGRAAACVER